MNAAPTKTRSRWPWISRRLLVLPPILVGLAVVISLASTRKELPRRETAEEAIPLRVMRAELEPLSVKSVGYGTVKPKRVWSAVAEVSGRVTETYSPLRSGVFVSKGQPLVQIDAVDYELRNLQREAELEQATAERDQLELSEKADRASLKIQNDLLEARQAEVDRLNTLRGSDAASRSELDLARATYLSQAQAVQNLQSALELYPSRKQTANAKIAVAKSRLEESARDLKRTQIAAPIDGLLSNVSLEVGQYLAPTQQIFDLLDVSSVEIEAQFSLSQLASLLPRQRSEKPLENLSPDDLTADVLSQVSATVITRSGDLELRYPAKPIRISELIDAQTRTLGIVVEVMNDPSLATVTPRGSAVMPLRPGMYCEVSLSVESKYQGVLLHRVSLDRDSVFVVDETNRLHRRRVQFQPVSDALLAVTGGLRGGEWVVLNPPVSPQDGMLVKPLIEEGADIAMLPSDSEAD